PLLYGPGTYRYRPIDEVVREVATSPTRAIVFWDDNIGARPRYAKELFRALTPLHKWWTSQCTANAASDEELVELAARSGCKALFLGFESISQASLAATNKGHNRVDDYRRLIAMLHRYGIAVHLGIMFGFDQDDAGIFRRTAEFLDEAGVDVAPVSMVVPMPGTPTFRRLHADGRILTTDWSKYDGKKHCVFEPAHVARRARSRDGVGRAALLFAAIDRPAARGLARGALVEPAAQPRLHARGPWPTGLHPGIRVCDPWDTPTCPPARAYSMEGARDMAATVRGAIRELLEQTMTTIETLLAATDRELPMSSSHVCAQGKDVWTLLTNDIDHEKIHTGQVLEGRYESRI